MAFTLIGCAALAISLAHPAMPGGCASSQPAPTIDSTRVLRSAAAAQRAFETFRRNRLPTADAAHDRCDVRVGRYCYWRGDGGDDDEPPEAPSITQRRDDLIRTLDTASHLLPGDDWIAGQRVRYRIEAGRTEAALRAAGAQCRAAASWCDALAGYAAQASGQFAAADSVYSQAIAAMQPAERCHWFDISDLLVGALARRFEGLGCSAREAFVRRLFWMGAPLYSVSETDLLTEYLARVTRTRIAGHSAAVDGETWRDDTRAMVLRYGWSRWYTRSMRALGSELEPSYTGHDAGQPYDFLPSAHAFDSVGHATEADWQLDDPRAQTGYAPSYARSIDGLPHQIARFRRGDSTLVVAAWDARRDTTLLGRSLDAALVLSDEGYQRAIARQQGAGAAGTISVSGVVDSGLVSLELLASKDHRAARVRLGAPAREPGRVTVSDLLLHTPTGGGSNDFAAVSGSALGSAAITGIRGLGVYWETYGLRPEGEPVRFTLAVERASGGWLHRAAERLRLVDASSGVRIQWEEVPRQMNGMAARDLRIDLSPLRRGRYRMQLSVTAAGEPPVLAAREIEIR